MKPLDSKSVRRSLALSEAEVTTQVKGWMEARGWTAIRLQSGLVRGVTRGTFINLGRKGLQDWIFLRGKTFVLIEMKAEGGKPSPDQTDWSQQCDVLGLPNLWCDGIERLQRTAKAKGIEL